MNFAKWNGARGFGARGRGLVGWIRQNPHLNAPPVRQGCVELAEQLPVARAVPAHASCNESHPQAAITDVPNLDMLLLIEALFFFFWREKKIYWPCVI